MANDIVVNDLTTKGWTIVDTSEFFEPIPNFYKNKIQSVLTTLQRPRFYQYFFENDLLLKKYIRFLIKTIKLPNEDFRFSNIQYRYITNHDGFENYQKWHKDGCYIRTITPLSGASTEYLPSSRCKKPRIIPCKHTLIFTGRDRAAKTKYKCTLHRTPQYDSPRELLVGSFN